MGTSKKRGRPFSEESELRYDLKVRVDEETKIKITKYSEDLGITIAESVRKAIKEFLKNK